MNQIVECPHCHTKFDCEVETEVIGLREHQDVEVQSRITGVILDEATEVPDVGFELLAERTPLIKPIIVLASDDSDLYRDGVAAGRRQAQAEATEGRWKGER